MTPDGSRSLACQGLHNASVLPYGSSRTVRLPVTRRHSRPGPTEICRLAGRMNASAADHAWAWFQGKDRLETARNRRECIDHRAGDHLAGPHPEGVDTGVILTALTDIAPHRIALAALCVVGAFCTLTFYDFFALRTIGKTHVPYRIAALSSFTSYTIGHNIGATVFTGGAIRFRIYSDYGLSAIDVARSAFCRD